MNAALGNPLRGYEHPVALFFLFLCGMGLWRSIGFAHESILILILVFGWSLCRLEERIVCGWSRLVREWMSLAAILLAYWSLELFSRPQTTAALQGSWVIWDRWILDDAGLKTAIEAAGNAIPVLLETAYLLLYAIPPLSLGLLYAAGERRRANRLLEVLFVGTFVAYGLILFIPTQSPRVLFAGQDLPAYNGFPRSLNVWLLDHLDISTSVFPSGHVAVAFSCAFGMLRAVPRRPWMWLSVFFLASLVFVATIYGRYHYAVDSMASLGIASAASWLSKRIWHDDAA